MRLRNVSGAKEKIEASKYIVLEPKENKGKWKKVCMELWGYKFFSSHQRRLFIMEAY